MKYKNKKVKKRHTVMLMVEEQTPHSRVSIHDDRMRKALQSGKRKTAWGTTYWETRQNRSDKRGTRL